MLAVLSVLTVRTRFSDPDMWWHLKTGEVVWTTHTVPTIDLFSYTTHHHAWVPHEWLSEVLIYAIYRWGGYSGLMLWLCAFTALLLITSYILCARYSGNAKTAFLGALIVWLFATVGLAIRPQLIGYLFLLLELLLVYLGATRNSRWLFWLPPLFALWVNCHGSFFLGLIVLCVFAFCSYFDFQLGLLASTRWEPRPRRTLMAALLLSIAALFLNPVGVDQVLYPLRTIIDLPLCLRMVDEWKPLEFSDPRAFAMLGILGCVFLLALIRKRELLWHELIMLALGTELAASHRRMLFVFGLLAAPVVSRLIATEWDGYDAEKDHPVPNAIMITLSLIIVLLAFPHRTSLVKQVADNNPVGAAEFIKTSHISGNMLNSYTYGGYLIWALPEHPVFLDGRGDVFEWVGVLSDFSKWALLQTDPNILLSKYDIRFCVLERSSSMAQMLKLLPGWKLAYSDDVSVVFVKSMPESHPALLSTPPQ